MSDKLYLTGASGLLGRAIRAKFQDHGWEVFGTAFNRVSEGLHKVDLTNRTELKESITNYKPSFIIHCAAQRFPDKVEKDPIAAEDLNVGVTEYLTKLAECLSVPVLYISTDYVFDGTNPPYKVSDEPNPLNSYGKMKLHGEHKVLRSKTRNIVLRIPVLYGPVERLSESAVTVLLENLLDESKTHNVSNYEKRCPSHVDDIAEISFHLATKKQQGHAVQGIYHWSGKEKLTKYEMVQQIADIFKLPQHHISPASEPPKASTPRPYDTTLDTSDLEELGIGQHTQFRDGIYSALRTWVE